MADNNPFSLLFNRPPSTELVRLAVLQPGASDDALKVLLKQCHPHETSYDCIGYDRASNVEGASIDVDGEPYIIPMSLKEALSVLRFPDKERYLWADVLVGSSAEERSLQASATKTTLENASKTIVWLGPTNSTLAAAFDILQILANRWNQAALHAAMPSNWTQSRPEQLLIAREKLLSFPPEPLDAANTAVWQAIQDIFCSPCLKSINIIPELVLSVKSVVMLGRNTMGWNDFVAASRAYPGVLAGVKAEAPSEAFMQAFQIMNSHETAIRRYRNDDGLELLPMIQSSRDCSSNDPREIVFSMLPITRESKRTNTNNTPKPEKPRSDYSKSVQDVFKEAAEYIILERQDLLLWWSEQSPCKRIINGLPSWVPDWSSPNPKTGYFVSPNNDLRRWSDSVPSPKTIRIDSLGLRVQAHALDRIESVGAIFTAANCRRLVLTEWQTLPSAPGETPQAKSDRFWRTLVMDHAGLGESRNKPAKPPTQLFQSWRSMIAEEQVLSLLNCSVEEFASNPDLQARARSDPNISQFGPLTGQSQSFEELLRKNALGRRFFTTVSGRTGMTAVEQREEREAAQETPPVPNFDDAMGDILAHDMLSHFQTHLQQRDPRMAQALADGIRGELPGQAPPGVRANDLVVACVGGFQPYVLRPENAYAVDQDVGGNLQVESTYTYVGSCYVHGIMDGECFTTRDWIGRQRFRTDVELVDITVV